MKGKVQQTQINQDIEIHDDKIILQTTVNNQGSQEKTVNIHYPLQGPSDNKVFYPSQIENQTNRYTVMTDQDKKGLSLGVTSNIPQTTVGSNPFKDKQSHEVKTLKRVPPGESLSLRAVLTPINIWNSEHSFKFNPKQSNYLENPLIKPKGSVDLPTEEGTKEEKTSEILSKLSDSKTMKKGEFSHITREDISKKSLNSLGAALAYKETCIEEKIPCKMIIGKSGDSKYAWIEAKGENGWKSLNPHKGIKEKPEGYEKIYEEPQPKYVEVQGDLSQNRNYMEATTFLLSTGGTPLLIYLLLISSIMIGLFIALSWKSKWIIKSLGKPSGEEIKEAPTDGEYNILSEEKDIDKESVKTIFHKLKEEDGKVDIQKYSEETRYSKEFIEHCVRYLREEEHIKKEETEEEPEEIEEHEEVEETEDKEETKKKNRKNRLKEIANKMGLTPLQLLLILAVVTGGIGVLSIVLLML